MTQEEVEQYNTMITVLLDKTVERNKTIKLYQEKLKTVNSDEIDECIGELDKLQKECSLDRELSEDIQNMLEVEHFLEHGCGRTFDKEY